LPDGEHYKDKMNGDIAYQSPGQDILSKRTASVILSHTTKKSKLSKLTPLSRRGSQVISGCKDELNADLRSLVS